MVEDQGVALEVKLCGPEFLQGLIGQASAVPNPANFLRFFLVALKLHSFSSEHSGRWELVQWNISLPSINLMSVASWRR